MDDSQIVLFADFDSGNMARYERVPKSNSQATQSQPSNQNSNLVESFDQVNPVQPIQQKYDIEFNVWTRPDCDGTPAGPNPNRTWFYFGVRGGHGKFIKFNLMNLNRQGRLFEMGMLPVFKTVPGHEKWSRLYIKPTWQTIDNQFFMSFIHRFADRKDSISYFAFCYPHSYDDCQAMLDQYDRQFEYCKNLNPDNCNDETIYYHRELLCHSFDRKRIDLITISACNDLAFETEPRFDPEYLFPKSELDPNPRCFKFDNKRVYVLSSRVHPGETPASFVFNGFLEFILRKDDPRSKVLRKNFVFKLIPILNPDGVSRGHYRTDQWGVNLNRVYLDPDFDKHPSIYAVKSLLVYHHINNRTSKEHDGLSLNDLFKLEHDTQIQVQKEDFVTTELDSERILPSSFTRSRSKSFVLNCGESEMTPRKLKHSKSLEIGNENSDEEDTFADELNPNPKAAHLNDPRLAMINPIWSGIAFYVDLHGHAAKRGCFIYGNSIDNELYQIENVLFAKLVAMNSQHFDFEGSNFSVKNMVMKDKREGLSKEGSGRVAMYKILGIIHSYTLECSYASGRSMNTIAPAANWNPRIGAISPPLHSDLPPKFQTEHYADVGKALAIAALDISETNPHTRVNNSSFGNLESVRNWIKFYIRSKNGGGIVNANQTSLMNKKPAMKTKAGNTVTKPSKLAQLPRQSIGKIKPQRGSVDVDTGSDEKVRMRKNLSLTSKSAGVNNSNLVESILESRLGHRKLLPISKANVALNNNSVPLFNKVNLPEPVIKKKTCSSGEFRKIDSRLSLTQREFKSEVGSNNEDEEAEIPKFYVQNDEFSKEKEYFTDKLEKGDFNNPEALKNESIEIPIGSNQPICSDITHRTIKSQSINLLLSDFNKKIIRLKRK